MPHDPMTLDPNPREVESAKEEPRDEIKRHIEYLRSETQVYGTYILGNRYSEGRIMLSAIETLLTELSRQAAERDNLQAFKDFVHDYYTAHGVPHHPPGTHGEHGCRIGDRMDWVWEQLSAAQAERDELAACLRRCAVNSSEATGDESKDLPQLEAAVTVPLNEIDDLVNDRFVDMECRLTQAQAATAGLVGDFTEAVSLLSVMAIEGAQFLRRLSCYERVENTEKFYQAICESEKFTAKAIALVESAALANYPAAKEKDATNG